MVVNVLNKPLLGKYGYIMKKILLVVVFSLISGGGWADVPLQLKFLDLNDDGVVDVSYEYDDQGYFELVDSNFDAKVDQSHRYGKDDRIISSKTDDDFDGFLETSTRYERGAPKVTWVDISGDGLADLVFLYDRGIVFMAKRFYKKVDGGESAQIGVVDFKFGYPLGKEKRKSTKLTGQEFHSSMVPK